MTTIKRRHWASVGLFRANHMTWLTLACKTSHMLWLMQNGKAVTLRSFIATWKTAAEELSTRVFLLVFDSLLYLSCGFGHKVLGGVHIGLNVVHHGPLFLHQQGQLEKQIMDVSDATLQLQKLLMAILDLSEC